MLNLSCSLKIKFTAQIYLFIFLLLRYFEQNNMRVKRLELQKLDSEPYNYTKVRDNQSSVQKWKTSPNTPNIYPPNFLPRIDSCFHSIHNSPRQGIDRLQSYVHKLLIDQQQNAIQIRRQKQLKKEYEQRKENQILDQQREQKIRQKLHLMKLKVKLNQLKNQAKLQQKRLLHQYSLNQRINNNHNPLNDKIYNQKQTNKKDVYIQTQMSSNQTIEEIKAPSCKGIPRKQKSVSKPLNYKRKFRIAGYVVYFALLFPKYVKIFRELRRKHFIENVVSNKSLQKQSKKYLSIVSNLKINSFIKELIISSDKQEQDVATFSFSQINDQGQETQFSIKLSNISETVLFILKAIKSIIQDGSVNKLIKVFSYYFIDRSFISDAIFLIDQLYRLQINLKQKYLILDKEQQKNLLINQLLAKITVFMFMLSKKIYKEVNKSSQLKANSKHQKEDKQFQRTIQLGGLYLFDKCNKVNCNIQKDQIYQINGNIQQLDKDDLPKIMKQLLIDQNFDFQLNDQQLRRVSIEQHITFSYLNNNGIKFKNMQKAQDLVKTITQHSNRQQQIQNIISDIGNQLLKKCRLFRIQHYSQIHQAAINQKYYLTKDIQVQQNSLKRLPKQIKLIQQYIILIQKARNQARRNKKNSAKRISLINSKLRDEVSIQNSSIHHNQSASSIVNYKNIRKSRDTALENNSKKSSYMEPAENISKINGSSSKLSKHRGSKSQQIFNQIGPNNNLSNQNMRNNRNRKDSNFKTLVGKAELQKIQEGSENKQ